MTTAKTAYRRLPVWLSRALLSGSVLLALALIIFFVNRGPENTSKYKGHRKVTIKKIGNQYRFMVNDTPFLVKGGAGYAHVKELAECGGNTMVCWDTTKLKDLLKQAAEYNVEIIIGLDIPGGDNTSFYNDPQQVMSLYNSYIHIVNKYKDDPHVLAWCLGNELAMPFSLLPTPFYRTYNKILQHIHDIDPNHPVATSVINVFKRGIMMIKWRIPALDFYCINIYNSLKTIQHQLNLIKLFWNGPYLIGEWAPNAAWEAPMNIWKAPIEYTSTKKAVEYSKFYERYMPRKDPRFLGSVVFYWGWRQEYTYTWFSIFNNDGVPTEVEESLSDCWKDTVTEHSSPQLKYELIDGQQDHDTIILSTGSKHYASVTLKNPSGNDSLRYCWQILKEDWALFWGERYGFLKRAPAVPHLFADSTLRATSFTAPLKEGPYRIFVTVYNRKGYCATANIPVYVVER